MTVELEGTEQFVREELKFFKQEWLSKPPPSPTDDTRGGMRDRQTNSGTDPNIMEFIAGMKPAMDMERAAIVAYYLKTYKKIDEVDGKLMNRWFIQAGWKPSPKPGNTLDNAMRSKGYFDKAQAAGKFKLSDAGTYYVEQAVRLNSAATKVG